MILEAASPSVKLSNETKALTDTYLTITLSWIPDPKTEAINVACFKPTSFVMFCYAAIDNEYPWELDKNANYEDLLQS